MKEKIFFYYTNDLHSDFTHWPKVVNYFNERRKYHLKNKEMCLLFDIGDHIDRVHPIAEAFMGRGNIRLLNEANYDVVTLGNNEGITLAHHELYHLYDDAQFDVVCSNLNSFAEKNPDWLQRVVYKTTNSNITIAIIGLTAAFNPFYHLLNWHVEQPLETLEKLIPTVSKKADIILLLSHLGLSEDRMIAETFPQIDVIIGGHTHHLLRTGERVHNTLLTAAGKHCTYVGEGILTWDHKRQRLINKEAYTTNITHKDPDEQVVASLKQLERKAIEKLSTPITTINETLKVDWFKETKIMKQLTETLQKWTGADISMLNAGLLLEDFKKGTITYQDIHERCPHPINPVVVHVTGREIKEIVRVGQTDEFMNLHIRGFGFRGKVLGKMIFSGLDIHYRTNKNQSYIAELFIKGEKIKENRTYSLATADMFIFGRLLPEIAKSKKKKLFLPEFIRDLLVHTLRSEK